mmetsp:Transcript_34906/g.84453  ORF Transcript_34906/g.84453 Transcript_34906/m.84453 type:complete len:733 (+) Transcript_34906:137-2335(+)
MDPSKSAAPAASSSVASIASSASASASSPLDPHNDNNSNSISGNDGLGSSSVVEDLMEVYNNMAQSKTPYIPPGEVGHLQGQRQGQQVHQSVDGTSSFGTATNNSNLAVTAFEQGAVPAGYQSAAAATTGYTIPPPIFPAGPSSSSSPHSGGSGGGSSPGHHHHHHHPSPPSRDTEPSFNFDQQPHTSQLQQFPQASYLDEQQQPVANPDQQLQISGASSEDGANAAGHSRRKKRRASEHEETTTATTVLATQSTSSSVSSVGGGTSKSNNGGRSKKKSKSSDGRWTKRFTWPEDLHRDFVSAIFDVGLKHSSPSTVLEHMPKHEQITTERIKSHLQKYRLHRSKSKKEFLSSYEASLRTFQGNGGAHGARSLAGGEVAAHLSYYMSTGAPGSLPRKPTAPNSTNSVTPVTNASASSSNNTVAASRSDVIPPLPMSTTDGLSGTDAASTSPHDQSNALMLPLLTESEKQSPIGSSMGYLMGLFFSLKQQLMIQRSTEAAGEKAKIGTPVQDVFNSFATSGGNANAAHAPPTAATAATGTAGLGPDNAVMAHAIATAAAAAQPIPASAMPSVRTDMEENSLMKREMQNQMALQNKMRALKQQELAKYRHVPAPSGNVKYAAAPPGHSTANMMDAGHDHSLDVTMASASASATTAQPTREDDHHHDHYRNHSFGKETAGSHGQGSGETDGSEANNKNNAPSLERSRALSFGGVHDDFWNTDMVDDNLFEFLMNN